MLLQELQDDWFQDSFAFLFAVYLLTKFIVV